MKEVILGEATDKIYLNQVKTGKIIVRTKNTNSISHYVLVNFDDAYYWIGLKSYHYSYRNRYSTMAEAIKSAKNKGFRVHIFEDEYDLAKNLKKII